MHQNWQTIAAIERAGLREARLQAHCAVQWLARAVRAFVPPRPDDGHTNLGWDAAFGGFVTHPLRGGSTVGLTLVGLTLVAGANPDDRLALDGHSDGDARVWLGRNLAGKGLPAGMLDEPSPYETPTHAIARGALYAPDRLAQALAQLAAWYANANCVLGRVRESLVARGFDAPPVRCWPHHFDLDTLVSLGGSRTLGVGFSPGDDYYDEPYFYLSIYPEPDVKALPMLPMIGHWHEHEFTAAIATASRIAAAKDQAADTEHLLMTAIDIGLKAAM